MRFVYVGLGGAAGALARYGLVLTLGSRSFPWATLGVNLSGSFALGVVLTVAADRGWSPEAVAAAAVGFLGAYTTFATFSWETFALVDTDRVLAAALYVGASVTLGILAAWAGHVITEAVLS